MNATAGLVPHQKHAKNRATVQASASQGNEIALVYALVST